jgi:hypothetical protein
MTGLVRKAILFTVGASTPAHWLYAERGELQLPGQPGNAALIGKNAANTPAEDSFGELVTVRDGGKFRFKARL